MKFISLTLAFLFSCAPKVMILQSPVISMTKFDAGSVTAFQQGNAVEEKWCTSDKPIKKNNDGSNHYGLIDQVVLKAHKNTHASFFLNSRFYEQGDCVYMSAYTPAGDGQASPSTKSANSKKKSRKR